MFDRFDGFRFSDVSGIGREAGVTRRDPAPVIGVDEVFHVWYSRTTESPHGYWATIYHATSTDGYVWDEHGEALGTGRDGAFDDHAVFTPTILVAQGAYWLYYTAVPAPFTNDDGGPKGTPTAIGVARAESPFGPWRRVADGPILTPGAEDSEFDSHRVDDACLLVRDGRYFLYYKGRQRQMSPGQTKMGLAIADHPAGPFVKHETNPLIGSGHEVCVFPYGSGVGCLVAPSGPEGRTLQFAPDGIRFSIMTTSERVPAAPGPLRHDRFADCTASGLGPGIDWGLCIGQDPDHPFLQRFDCNLRFDG